MIAKLVNILKSIIVGFLMLAILSGISYLVCTYISTKLALEAFTIGLLLIFSYVLGEFTRWYIKERKKVKKIKHKEPPKTYDVPYL